MNCWSALNAYKDILDFAEMVPVSAQNGENVDDLIETMFSLSGGRPSVL